MKTKEEFLAVIRDELQGSVGPDRVVRDNAALADLGITSLQLIAVVLKIQRKYALNVAQMIERGMPTTVGDLVGLLESGAVTSVEKSVV